MTLSEHPGAGIAGNYEIIERILLHLPRRDLARAWLVNKAFRNVFTTSQEVKNKLRMDFPHGKTVYLNTFPAGPFGVIRVQWLRKQLFLDIYGFDKRRARRSHSDAGWRLIPLFLPDAEAAYFMCAKHGSRQICTLCKYDSLLGYGKTEFSLSGFVTMGQLSDTLLEFTEKHEIQESIRLIQIIYDRPKDSKS